MRAGLVSPEEIRELEIVRQIEHEAGLQKLLPHNLYVYCNRLVNGLINLLASDLIRQTLDNIARFVEEKKRAQHFDEEIVRFSASVDPLQNQLNKFIYQEIIFTPENRGSDDDAVQVLRGLFRAYYVDPALWPAHIFSFASNRAAMITNMYDASRISSPE
jgi:dGTP triphosphohydrolase